MVVCQQLMVLCCHCVQLDSYLHTAYPDEPPLQHTDEELVAMAEESRALPPDDAATGTEARPALATCSSCMHGKALLRFIRKQLAMRHPSQEILFAAWQ